MGSSLNLKGGSSTPKNIVETFSQANTFVEGDVVRYDMVSNTWVKAQADSAENSEVAGVVSGSSTTSFDITYSGYISVPALAGSSAPVLFLDSTIAGGLTASPPSAIGTVVKPVMTKTTNGTGYIVTNYLGTQIGGSSTVAIDEIQPVGTVVPFAGSAIPDSWLECNGASYAVGAYPYLYSKLQYSSGDRAPAYGYVANIVVGNSPLYAVGQVVSQATTGLSGTVLAHTALGSVNTNTLTVQVIPTYSSTTKNFVQPNAVFSNAAVTIDTVGSSISAVSITHFNTPDLRGRFAVGANTSRLPTINDLESDAANNSAISGIYSLGSEGGQEFVVATPVSINSAATGTAVNVINNIGASSNIANIPPYTVVRYIIKASPYTRAAIIDGIDIPYTSLLVGDLRDGSLRPGGSGEDLLFKTNDGTSGVERMRLTNAGKLGIGTTTPQHKFVVSQGNDTLEFQPGHQTDVSFIQALNRSTNLFTTSLSFRAKDFTFTTSSGSSPLINSSGQVNIPNTTDSTSTTIGGLTLGGGLGMALNLTVGGGISAAGGITFSGLTRLTNTTAATSPSVAAFTVAGGIGANSLHVGAGGQNIAGPLNVTSAGAVNMASTVESNSTSTGALTVVGGVGIQGTLHVGGGITTAGGISMGGALTVGGGITAARLDCSGVMKSGSITTGSFSANTLSAISNTQSDSTNSGDLVVAGGAGIGKNLYVGGGITATGSLNLGSGAITTSGSLNCGNITSTGTFSATTLNASDQTASTNTGSGALVVVGGAGIGKNLIVGAGISAAGGITFSGITRVTNGTSATSTNSAALLVTGGVGIQGGLYVGGITTAGGISMGGALTVGGGLGVTGGGITFGGLVRIRDFTTSTSTSTGALVVSGSVGVGGRLYVGGGMLVGGDGITLAQARLAPPTGSAPIFGVRAWGNVSVSGVLEAGGNIASTSYLYPAFSVIFNTPMLNTDYCVVGSAATGVNNNTRCFKTVSKSLAGFSASITDANSSYNAEPFQFMVIA